MTLADDPENCKQKLEDCGADVACITKVMKECLGNYIHCTNIKSMYQVANSLPSNTNLSP